MVAYGYGAQVVKITPSHSYELDEYELEKILMKDDIQDLPAVVVSVAGAYRGGKSFLLNFFLRYLSASQSAQQDGSWLGEADEPLSGFQWRSGIKRTTTGIQMWSEPFVCTLPSGEKVAVLLIDTQGAFDSKSTVRDSSTIFAMSTLLSSVQIYNISHNIQEDDLQQLQLFTGYAKLVKDKDAKAFQLLKFLVRDWQYPTDHPYGLAGGEQLLQNVLSMTSGIPKELQELRQHIRSSFEKVSCFLMPHPGFKILNSNSNGRIADIDIKFRTQLVDLVQSLFNPENLLPKTVNGEQIKAKELFQYFKTYMTLFNSDTIPNPTSIMQATVEAGLRSAMNEARDIYQKGMDAECGEKELNVPAVDLNELHLRYLRAARAFFSNKKKMGSREDADKYLLKLTKELENRMPQFVQINQAKSQAAIEAAKESYEEKIQSISPDHIMCVHPLDLDKIHKEGVDSAMATYDASRKRLTNKKDVERPFFLRSFEKRHESLKLTNEQNNMMIVSMILRDYWQKMQDKTSQGTPMRDADLTHEHEVTLKQALEEFDAKRSMPSHYTEDIFRTKLVTMINTSLRHLKALNKSMNSLAIQAAVDHYDHHMRASINQCLHPSDLEREHQQGLCRALGSFRPEKKCSDGFDYTDEDEMTLMEIIQERHQHIQTLNNYINKNAVQTSFTVYLSSMEDLSRPSLYWILVQPMINSLSDRTKYHEQSKVTALQVFYNKRKYTGQNSAASESYSSDPFKDQLIQLMDSAYNRNYKINGAELLPLLSQGLKVAQTYLMSSIAAGAVIPVYL